MSEMVPSPILLNLDESQEQVISKIRSVVVPKSGMVSIPMEKHSVQRSLLSSPTMGRLVNKQEQRESIEPMEPASLQLSEPYSRLGISSRLIVPRRSRSHSSIPRSSDSMQIPPPHLISRLSVPNRINKSPHSSSKADKYGDVSSLQTHRRVQVTLSDRVMLSPESVERVSRSIKERA